MIEAADAMMFFLKLFIAFMVLVTAWVLSEPIRAILRERKQNKKDRT